MHQQDICLHDIMSYFHPLFRILEGLGKGESRWPYRQGLGALRKGRCGSERRPGASCTARRACPSCLGDLGQRIWRDASDRTSVTQTSLSQSVVDS